MKHIKSLDSLRGIAAVMVFWYHCTENVYKPWFFFLAGHEAVILFFVLSGFVLSLSHEKTQTNFTDYVIKRVFRLYPVYYFMVFAAITIYYFIHSHPELFSLNDWTKDLGKSKLDFITVIKLIIMLPTNLNGVVWSTTAEILISIFILPLIWRYYRNYICLFTIYVTVMLILKLIRVYNHYGFLKQELDHYVFYYAFCFYAGVLAYKYQDKLKYFAKLSFLPIYIVLFSARYMLFGHLYILFSDILSTIASIGFIFLALYNERVKNFLHNKVIHFYGKISFSLYLLHPLVIIVVTCIFNNYFDSITILIIKFLVVTLISYITYKYIELPGIAIGKKLIVYRSTK